MTVAVPSLREEIRTTDHLDWDHASCLRTIVPTMEDLIPIVTALQPGVGNEVQPVIFAKELDHSKRYGIMKVSGIFQKPQGDRKCWY